MKMRHLLLKKFPINSCIFLSAEINPNKNIAIVLQGTVTELCMDIFYSLLNVFLNSVLTLVHQLSNYITFEILNESKMNIYNNRKKVHF